MQELRKASSVVQTPLILAEQPSVPTTSETSPILTEIGNKGPDSLSCAQTIAQIDLSIEKLRRMRDRVLQ